MAGGGYGRLLCGDTFFEATIAFTREARAFDPGLPWDGLWQALRNVWIGNTLQLLLEQPLTVNPGLFAYSMPYPLTDNLLDDPALDDRAKGESGERFGRRLAGLKVRPVGTGEKAVFRLVAQIEEEFPRPVFADVHAPSSRSTAGRSGASSSGATRGSPTPGSSRSAARRGAAACSPISTWWPNTRLPPGSVSRSATPPRRRDRRPAAPLHPELSPLGGTAVALLAGRDPETAALLDLV